MNGWRALVSVAAVVGACASSLHAQSPVAPAAPLDGLGFLVGEWASGRGAVAETGGSSTGRSTVTVEAGGHALLRRDHTDLLDAAGRPAGGFDQIMLIYPEAGAIHADYSDGSHVIHYTSATVVAGKSVTFLAQAIPDAPVFRLRYELTAPSTLAVDFAVEPSRGGAFRSIASGTLLRASR